MSEHGVAYSNKLHVKKLDLKDCLSIIKFEALLTLLNLLQQGLFSLLTCHPFSMEKDTLKLTKTIQTIV